MKYMANEKINLNNCTKEQIINVVKAAKERKLAWEKRVQSEMINPLAQLAASPQRSPSLL